MTTGKESRRWRASEEIKLCIRMIMKTYTKPISRNTLTTHVGNYLEEFHGLRWSRATVAREVRRAISELEQDGVPIVSDGTGFRMATTPDERAAAALKLERMGLACLRRAAAIRRLTLAQEARQLGLFEEVGDAT